MGQAAKQPTPLSDGKLAEAVPQPKPSLATEQLVPAIEQLTCPASTEQVVKHSFEEGMEAPVADQEQEEEQDFGSAVNLKPANDPPTAFIRSWDLRVANPTLLGVSNLMEAIV